MDTSETTTEPGAITVRMAERLELWKLEDLEPYPINAKKHPPEQVDELAEFIKAVGFWSPILVHAGVIVAGHGRVLAARKLGLQHVPVVPLDGVDEQEANAYRLADNQMGAESKAPWDKGLLMASLSELGDSGWKPGDVGFDASDLANLELDLDGLLDGIDDPDVSPAASSSSSSTPKRDDDELPPTPELPVTRRGDVWKLGEHLVLVGDSTVDSTHARVLELAGRRLSCILTDPPYAIYGSSSGLSSSMTDDQAVRPFFRSVMVAAEKLAKLHAHVYVFCDWRSWASWWDVAKGTHIIPRNMLVWKKGQRGMGSHYVNSHELVLFASLAGEQKVMRADVTAGQRLVRESNVLEFGRVHASSKEHNAQKPLALLQHLLENSTDAGDLVADLFLGSGTTIVACERLGRRCVGVEIDTKNADISIRRWARETGGEPVLIAEGNDAEVGTRKRTRKKNGWAAVERERSE